MDQLPRLGKRELICLLSFTCNYVVFVWRGNLFLWVLGMGYVILLWHSLSLPYNYFPLKLIKKQLIDETHKPKCESKWEAIFNQTFDWKSIWESISETLCSTKEKQFQWKIVHNAIFTEHKLQLMNFSNGLCHFL